MRESFAEDMFEHSTDIILCDEMLEGFVDEGCIRAKDGVGVGFGK